MPRVIERPRHAVNDIVEYGRANGANIVTVQGMPLTIFAPFALPYSTNSSKVIASITTGFFLYFAISHLFHGANPHMVPAPHFPNTHCCWHRSLLTPHF